MSIQIIGDCADCMGGICTMNCSSAVFVSGSEWIAASIWAGAFPAKASAAQVKAYLARERTCGGCIKLADCSYEFGAHFDDPVCTGYRWPLAVEASGEAA